MRDRAARQRVKTEPFAEHDPLAPLRDDDAHALVSFYKSRIGSHGGVSPRLTGLQTAPLHRNKHAYSVADFISVVHWRLHHEVFDVQVIPPATDPNSTDRGQLVASWQKAFKMPAPSNLPRELLERSLAYKLQVEKEGALGNRARGALLAAARSRGVRIGQPAPGSKIIREWHGVVHIVEVCENGFEYRGRLYRSLTAVAQEITGSHWPWPRFFGLRNRRP